MDNSSVIGMRTHVLTAGGTYDLVNRVGAPAPVSLVESVGGDPDADPDADPDDDGDGTLDFSPPEPA